MDAKRKKIRPAKKRKALPATCKKVMVVDDDKDFLDEIREVLADNGYRTIMISNGAAALRSARKHKPDVILLDIVMSKMNGFQVADELNKLPDTARIPVIAITGWMVRDEHHRIMDMLGIKEVLVKPLDPPDVISCITRVMHKGK